MIGHKRTWRNGKLFREIRDGQEITTNLGKTLDELGVSMNKPAHRTVVPKIIDPIPYEEWPLWAKSVAFLGTAKDKGIGDVVARIIGEENSAAFSAWHLATFGKSCNCKGRQAKWNKLYPLP